VYVCLCTSLLLSICVLTVYSILYGATGHQHAPPAQADPRLGVVGRCRHGGVATLSSLPELSISSLATLRNAPFGLWERATLTGADLAELTKLPRLHTLRLENLKVTTAHPCSTGSGRLRIAGGDTLLDVLGLERHLFLLCGRPPLRSLRACADAAPASRAARQSRAVDADRDMAEGLSTLEHLALDYCERHPRADTYEDLDLLAEEWENN